MASKAKIGPHGIPYRFVFFGVERQVRWGDPSGKWFQAKEDWGACSPDGKTIILNPMLRRKAYRVAAWTVFGHELGHMFNCEMDGKMIHRVSMDGRDLSTKWTDMRHDRIDKNATPMGALMMENPGIFSPAVE